MINARKVHFNIPLVTGKEIVYIEDVFRGSQFCGDGPYSSKCQSWLKMKTGGKMVLLTPSCTAALEMAAMLAGIKEGDEIIMPSYTFVSTANAFVSRGAKAIFVDIRPDTMNIDETKIEEAISKRTKAIVPVHYAGVSCDMDVILEIARKYGLLVIEDAAQGLMAEYRGQHLGVMGDIGCYSFHETKNYQCGEGGAIVLNRDDALERAEIVRQKGTNRANFLKGQVDKYSWVDLGSSYLPSEITAACLYAQLELADDLLKSRLNIWERYHTKLEPLHKLGILELPCVPSECKHNGHMFYIKLRNLDHRQKVISWLRERHVQTVFHYVPLHSSVAGRKYGEFRGDDKYTTRESERLLRLPMHYGLDFADVDYVTDMIGKCVYG